VNVQRVSVSSANVESDGLSRHFGVSAGGKIISFMSDATNLVADDTNGMRDVFVHDRRTGLTSRISVSEQGAEANGESNSGDMSGDGLYIAFHSSASNLVPNDTNGVNDVFVRNLETGELRRVSVSSDGVEGNGSSAWPSISSNGRYVAFRSSATNLVPGDTNEAGDAFVHDLVTRKTRRASLTASGEEPNGTTLRHAISPSGRYVAVVSSATNVVPGDDNEHADVFVHDWRRGTTALVTVGWMGEGANGDSGQMKFSGNDLYLAFPSWASNLVPDDTNGVQDVFVWNRVDRSIVRISVDSNGIEANGESSGGQMTRDGHLVFFVSDATNLVDDDTNGLQDVFVHDRTTGETERVSITASGTQLNANAVRPSLGRNGRIVALFSAADNVVPGDTNGVDDVFVYKRPRTFWQILR
jgi:Tol biopolymer transport system component